MSRARTWTTLALLAAVMAAGNTMTGSFSALQEAAKAEMSLSDLQLSLLQGLAVSIPLAALSIPVGLMVDRGNRVRLLFATSLAWTLGTLLTAFAASMPLLFVARMLAGVGASISTTIAISMAADLSAPTQRGRSLLLLTIGKYLGVALAFALSGALAGHFVRAGGLAGLLPWRSAHLMLGLASAALTLPILLLREPVRREREGGASAPFRVVFAELWARRRFIAPLFVGQLGVFMADASATIWTAPVLSRKFGLSPDEFGGWLGAVIFGSGVIGALAGGFAADIGHRGSRRGGIMVGAVIAAAVALPAALYPLAPSTQAFAAALFVLLFGGTITGLVTATAIAVLLPNELRGLTVVTFVALSGLIAFGISPTVVTLVSGWLGGEDQLGVALALVSGLVSLAGLAGFEIARRNAPAPV